MLENKVVSVREEAKFPRKSLEKKVVLVREQAVNNVDSSFIASACDRSKLKEALLLVPMAEKAAHLDSVQRVPLLVDTESNPQMLVVFEHDGSK
jgi:hypothetical protein